MSDTSESVNHYTRLQQRLHWLVVVLIVLQYSLQVPMISAMQAIYRGETLGFGQFLVSTLHTWSGITVAAIMLWRWQLRGRSMPAGGGVFSPLREKLVRWHHVSFYVVLVLMAFTGALHYFAELQSAARWHEIGKWILAVMIGVHVVGALTHVVRGDGVFQRMTGRGSLR